MKNLFLNSLVVIVSIILSLLVFEAFLRIKNTINVNYDLEMWKYSKLLKTKSENPRIGHVHIKNSSAILQKTNIRTNNFGLRGEDIDPEKIKNSDVYLFLGSSVLLGWGVEEDFIFTSLIEKEAQLSGKKVKVINAGVGNYNAERYVENYLENLIQLKPNHLVISYFVNDSENLENNTGNFLTRNFHFAVMIWKYFSTFNNEFGINSIENYYEAKYEENYVGYKKMKRSLEKLSAHCAKMQIDCSLIMIPDIHQLNPYKLNFIHERMEIISKELGFKFLDLLNEFEGEDQEIFWNDYNDPHPNKEGHARIADAFLDNFLEINKQ